MCSIAKTEALGSIVLYSTDMQKFLILTGTILLLTSCTRTGSDTGVSQQSAASSVVLSSESTSQSSIAFQPSEILAENLNIPWGIAFLPKGEFLVTERPGTLLRIGADRKQYPIQGVQHWGEGGLLGVVLHPDYEENHFIYLYFTTLTDYGTQNRIERYTFENDVLSSPVEILSGIPGAPNHDGGYMAFGPDGKLYVTTGDASRSDHAQDTDSLAGKILRLNDDGSLPPDNPFGNAVYSLGHRNPQGLTWDEQGNLWSTEHGRSGGSSGLDEINLIEKGKNYGWPVIQGSEVRDGMVTPVLHSGQSTTWAPASAEYVDGSIFFGGLRGSALYEYRISDRELREHIRSDYGRIRAVELGPDGFLYLTTSNRDGRGTVQPGDDKIIRVDPAMFR